MEKILKNLKIHNFYNRVSKLSAHLNRPTVLEASRHGYLTIADFLITESKQIKTIQTNKQLENVVFCLFFIRFSCAWLVLNPKTLKCVGFVWKQRKNEKKKRELWPSLENNWLNNLFLLRSTCWLNTKQQHVCELRPMKHRNDSQLTAPFEYNTQIHTPNKKAEMFLKMYSLAF